MSDVRSTCTTINDPVIHPQEEFSGSMTLEGTAVDELCVDVTKQCDIECTTGLVDSLVDQSGHTDTEGGDNSKEDETRLKTMQDAVTILLKCIGEDPGRQGLQRTPLRFAKALLQLTCGYGIKTEHVVNGALFGEQANGMAIVRDIKFFSLCEHHLLPFYGIIHIGYLPSRGILGLSKFARIAEVYCRRLQVQERLTEQIALAVVESVQSKDVAVVVSASHMCIEMRGVQKAGSTTVTTCFLGLFEESFEKRAELLSTIGTRS